MQFLRAFFLSIFLGMTLVGSLNYLVDPSEAFTSEGQGEREIARILAGGKNVYLKVNRNDRLLQKFRIAQQNSAPATLVLGSSRTLAISSQILGTPLINCSVGCANLEDLLSLGVLAKEKFRPKRIILGLDPWILNGNGFHTVFLPEEYLAARKRLGLPPALKRPSGTNPYLLLFNFDNTVSSIKLLIKNFTPEPLFYSTEATHSLYRYDLLRADGSRLVNQRILGRSEFEVAGIARKHTAPPYVNFYNYSSSPAEERDLRALIHYLQTEATLEIILPPMHPVAFAQLATNYPQMMETERLIRRIAAESGIRVWGAVDPTVIGCGPQDFYDDCHLREPGMIKVFAQ